MHVLHDTDKPESLKYLRPETNCSLFLTGCPEEWASHASIGGVEQRVNSTYYSEVLRYSTCTPLLLVRHCNPGVTFKVKPTGHITWYIG